MDTAELIKKVRRIEIKTKGLSKHIFSGEYHSAFKGRGMSFSEVRDYQYGDDVRNIDWNVTARTGDPFIKVFEEERELTLMLLVDISQSALFGTQNQFKNEIILEISAVLAFAAMSNNDKVGAILFTGEVEKYIPPKKGKKHILRIIRELIDFKAVNKGTSLNKALEFLNSVQKKKTISFIISDFICANYEDPLRIASKRHDIVGINVYDEREREMPNVGLMHVRDLETGERKLIDTGSKKVREQYNQQFQESYQKFKTTFNKTRTDTVDINTSADYVKSLLKFFKKRGR